MIGIVWKRLYRDYLMPDRMGDYERLLRFASDMAYRGVPVGAFRQLVGEGLGDDPAGRRLLVLRHDIDRSP